MNYWRRTYRSPGLTVTLCLALFGVVAFRHVPAQASGHALSHAAKKTCRTVVKRVHGKKRRIKVCTTLKAPPSPQPSHFQGLWSSAVDSAGNVYVVDRAAQKVDKLSPSGSVLAVWPVPPDPSTPESPDADGIAVDPQSNIYITDSIAGRIIKFSSSGEQLATWYTPDHGGVPGPNAEHPPLGPIGIALDAAGDLYVSSFDFCEVQKFSPSGALLATFGHACPQVEGNKSCSDARHIAPGELNHPDGIALDPQGNIYVNDHRSNRVVKLSPSGQQLAVFGPALAKGEILSGLEGIGVDRDGNLYVDDGGPPRVLKLSPTGQPLAQWRAPTGYGVGGDPGFDAQGNLYVTIGLMSDVGLSKVVKLSPALKVLATWQ